MTDPSTSTEQTHPDALLPPRIRSWLLAVVGCVVALSLYLIAVRGSSIIFDLRDAVSAFCF